MINRLGGLYSNGRALPFQTRQRIFELYSQGCRKSDISRITKVSHGCITKILKRFETTGTIEPGPIPNSPIQNFPNRRKLKARTIFTTSQKTILESTFVTNQYVNARRMTDLVDRTGLSQDCIRIWFANKRANLKKYQEAAQQSETAIIPWNTSLRNEGDFRNYLRNQVRECQPFPEYLQPFDEQPQNSEPLLRNQHPQCTTSYSQSQLPMKQINCTEYSNIPLQMIPIVHSRSNDALYAEFEREGVIFQQQHFPYISHYEQPEQNHYWTQYPTNETIGDFDHL